MKPSETWDNDGLRQRNYGHDIEVGGRRRLTLMAVKIVTATTTKTTWISTMTFDVDDDIVCPIDDRQLHGSP